MRAVINAITSFFTPAKTSSVAPTVQTVLVDAKGDVISENWRTGTGDTEVFGVGMKAFRRSCQRSAINAA